MISQPPIATRYNVDNFHGHTYGRTKPLYESGSRLKNATQSDGMRQPTVLEMIRKCESKTEPEKENVGNGGQNPEGSRSFWKNLEKEELRRNGKDLAEKNWAGKKMVDARKAHWEGIHHSEECGQEYGGSTGKKMKLGAKSLTGWHRLGKATIQTGEKCRDCSGPCQCICFVTSSLKTIA